MSTKSKGISQQSSRRYLNASKLDYFETATLRCARCCRAFKAKRFIWGGKVSIAYPELCDECSTLTNVPPLPSLVRSQGPKGPQVETTRRLTSEEAAAMKFNTLENLSALYHLASNGDERALPILVDLVGLGTMLIEQLARHQPELLRPLARKREVWPAFIGRKRGELNKWLLRELQLEAEQPKGRFSTASAATCVALVMKTWLLTHQTALNLPALNDSTVEHWFDRGWSALLYATQGKPWTGGVLGEIASEAAAADKYFRKRHKEKVQFSPKTYQRSSFYKKTITAAKRSICDERTAMIKAALRSSFFSVIGLSPQGSKPSRM